MLSFACVPTLTGIHAAQHPGVDLCSIPYMALKETVQEKAFIIMIFYPRFYFSFSMQHILYKPLCFTFWLKAATINVLIGQIAVKDAV